MSLRRFHLRGHKMVFLVQFKNKPKHLMIIRATSRLDAFQHAKLIDVPKNVWCLEAFDESRMKTSIRHIQIG